MTNPRKVNAALKKAGINGKMVYNRQGGSYYYFIGDLFDKVPSIYSYNLDKTTTEDILNHVQEHMNKED